MTSIGGVGCVQIECVCIGSEASREGSGEVTRGPN